MYIHVLFISRLFAVYLSTPLSMGRPVILFTHHDLWPFWTFDR